MPEHDILVADQVRERPAVQHVDHVVHHEDDENLPASVETRGGLHAARLAGRKVAAEAGHEEEQVVVDRDLENKE